MNSVPLDLIRQSESGAYFSSDRVYRYALWRNFDSGNGILLIIGLNPSTADEKSNDPTIRRCIGFAQSWGFRTLIVANLFGYRATQPKDLKNAEEPIGKDNDFWLRALSRYSESTLAAWGNHGKFLDRGKLVYDLLTDPKCLGLTKQGFPRHPLYVKASAPMKNYPS